MTVNEYPYQHLEHHSVYSKKDQERKNYSVQYMASTNHVQVVITDEATSRATVIIAPTIIEGMSKAFSFLEDVNE